MLQEKGSLRPLKVALHCVPG